MDGQRKIVVPDAAEQAAQAAYAKAYGRGQDAALHEALTAAAPYIVAQTLRAAAERVWFNFRTDEPGQEDVHNG